MEFLADNNVCGQMLLRLIARGNRVIAEMRRLSIIVPDVFRLENKADVQKYGEVLLDFAFFTTPETFTQRIENSEALSASDAFIREQHLTVITRIYSVFESVYRYVTHLVEYLKDLHEGTFLHCSTDLVFADHEGRQLMCEGLYLYGVMLLFLDYLFPGPVRERLLVAYHRHDIQTASKDTNVDDVCQLMRSTSPRTGSKRVITNIDDYFSRIEIPSYYIERVIGHLRTDDLYNQVSVYPSPDHRVTAFSTQAAMLYVCLYFSPQTLQNSTQKMREIVDRFFPDNWIVSFYMGTTCNLVEAWEPYKAAKLALVNTIEVARVKLVSRNHGALLKKLSSQSCQLESEGALTEDRVLKESVNLLQLVRDCNVTLRWLMLHCASSPSTSSFTTRATHKRCSALRELVVTEVGYTPEAVFELLLHTACLELKLSLLYKLILQKKCLRWQQQISIAETRLRDLAEAFTEGDENRRRPLARVRPNAKLQQWFSTTSQLVAEFDMEDDSQSNVRRIIQLVNALKQVQEYHDLSSCGGAVQAIEETEAALREAALLATVQDAHVTTLATVADLSYAWSLIDEYTGVMQRIIRQEPGEVSKLRAVFLKLSSGLELPLLRISQARDNDALSVSNFYSGTLVSYIRKIIPETMFSLLETIAELQTHHLSELPTRLDKNKVKDFAHLPQRYKMAELCHSVAALAEGVTEMGRTLVGVVEVRPSSLLEDGVRRELVHRLAAVLHTKLVFSGKKGSGELFDKLSEVARILNGFRSSFEYVQDYINLYALKIWHEELTRIISVSVERECALLAPTLSHAVEEEEGYTCVVPVPSFSFVDGHKTFMGRLAAELLRITDPRSSTYSVARAVWYDNGKQRAQVADAGLLTAAIERALTAAALAGLDRLFACRTTLLLSKFFSEMELFLTDANSRSLLDIVIGSTTPKTALIGDPVRQYNGWVTRSGRLFTSIELLQSIGQLQLLLLHSHHRRNASCAFQANHLHEALRAFNDSLLNDMWRHGDSPSMHSHPDPSDDNPLTTKLTRLLDWAGLSAPLERVYVKVSTDVTSSLPHLLLLVVLNLLPKLHYVSELVGLSSLKLSEGIDGSVVCVGIACALRQLPRSTGLQFLSLLAQFVASHTAVVGKTGLVESLPQVVRTATAVLKQVGRLLAVSEQQLQQILL